MRSEYWALSATVFAG